MMPDTRSTQEIITIIDKKFNEFKDALINDLKNELKAEITREIEEDLGKIIVEKKNEISKHMESVVLDDEHSIALRGIQKHVKELQQKTVNFKKITRFCLQRLTTWSNIQGENVSEFMEYLRKLMKAVRL